ncbi:MAG: hypothetical protein LM580_12005 [Thermofilum sp.]|nr:hypothetical protein [Thermofilum sp.]
MDSPPPRLPDLLKGLLALMGVRSFLDLLFLLLALAVLAAVADALLRLFDRVR